MQLNINSLIGNSMEATDGDIGKVEEFYFDDDTWTVRYLVVKTGNWLSGREVLIAPQALIKDCWMAGRFPINLTKELIKDSPDIDTDKPVSRQQEIALYGHYAWERYGGSGFYAGGSAGFLTTPFPILDEKVIKETDNNGKKPNYDSHLRSTKIVTGYHIHAVDGEIGHVHDFIIDKNTWQIVFLVVDTHNWFGGKKVLVPVTNIKEVQWENSKVIINETKESIKNREVFEESHFFHHDISNTVM
jgi:uncharacterized protein YrrD